MVRIAHLFDMKRPLRPALPGLGRLFTAALTLFAQHNRTFSVSVMT